MTGEAMGLERKRSIAGSSACMPGLQRLLMGQHVIRSHLLRMYFCMFVPSSYYLNHQFDHTRSHYREICSLQNQSGSYAPGTCYIAAQVFTCRQTPISSSHQACSLQRIGIVACSAISRRLCYPQGRPPSLV